MVVVVAVDVVGVVIDIVNRPEASTIRSLEGAQVDLPTSDFTTQKMADTPRSFSCQEAQPST